MRKPCVLLLLLVLAGPAGADEESLPLEARVNRAIDRAARNLLSRQAPDGSWQKDDPVHPHGRTALCGYALLHAGLPRDHEAIRQALVFLGVSEGYASDLEPRSTYEAGSIALFLNALGQGHAATIRRVAAWLVEHFDAGQGLWGYPDGTPDLSNTHYAVFALVAAARHGFETPRAIWKRLIDSVGRLQSDEGAIRYRGGAMYRASMTHAGLLVWKFAHEALGEKRPSRRVADGMERARTWLDAHYDVERHPYGHGWTPSFYFYYLYGLERYAVFFGLDRIAGHDWYREGAETLLERQEKDGSWGSLEDTSFAILFLRRATLTEPDGHTLGEGGEGQGPPPRLRPADGVPFLSRWLAAGPFPGTKEEDDQLDRPALDPRRVRPLEGGRADSKRWIPLQAASDGKVDLGEALGAAPWSAFCAACYLHADADTDAVLWLASDDGVRAWLDGEEILLGHHHDYSGDDFYRVPLRLAGGRHVLLLQVENHEYYVYFRARLSTPEGRPLAGVLASTERR